MAFNLEKGFQVFPELLETNQLSEFLSYFPITSTGLDGAEPSEVFDRTTKKKMFEITTRDSSRIKLEQCPQLFDQMKKTIICKLQSQIPNHEIILREDDLEMIQYQPGQFFKAHTDHQNFMGNFFKSYTLVLCCQSCQKGGQTMIYLDHLKAGKPIDELEEGLDYVLIHETGQVPGSVLIFDKDLFHEGHPVLEGQKVIMIANLVLIPNSSQMPVNQHYLKVNFADQISYLIPESWLDVEPFKKTYYSSSLQFKIGQKPKLIVHDHQESLETLDTFQILYKKMSQVFGKKADASLEKLERMVNGLRLINYPFPKEVDEFVTFLNSKCAKEKDPQFFGCCLASYYEYLKLFDRKSNPGIIPVVLVEITGDTGNVTAWLGIGNNQLLTLDLKPARMDRIYDPDIGYDVNGPKTTTKIRKPYITGFHDLCDGSFTNLEFIFQKFGGEKLSDLSNADQDDSFHQMQNYIISLMSTINPSKEYSDSYVLRERYEPNHLDKSSSSEGCQLEELSEKFSHFPDYTTEEIKEFKTRLDIKALYEYLNSLDVGSSDTVQYSAGRVCNEASYFDCRVEVTAGFVRLNPEIFGNPREDREDVFTLRKHRNSWGSGSESDEY